MIEFIVRLARCDDSTSRRESRPDQIFGKDKAATRLWDTSNESTISNMSAISQSRVVTPAAIAGVMREFSTDDYLVVTCKSDIGIDSLTLGDNAAMESFFSSLKTERTARKLYRTRDEAKADVFDYIERFYNPKRRHSRIGYMSPMEFERQAGLA
jgi:hypothetical protein